MGQKPLEDLFGKGQDLYWGFGHHPQGGGVSGKEGGKAEKLPGFQDAHFLFPIQKGHLPLQEEVKLPSGFPPLFQKPRPRGMVFLEGLAEEGIPFRFRQVAEGG